MCYQFVLSIYLCISLSVYLYQCVLSVCVISVSLCYQCVIGVCVISVSLCYQCVISVSLCYLRLRRLHHGPPRRVCVRACVPPSARRPGPPVHEPRERVYPGRRRLTHSTYPYRLLGVSNCVSNVPSLTGSATPRRVCVCVRLGVRGHTHLHARPSLSLSLSLSRALALRSRSELGNLRDVFSITGMTVKCGRLALFYIAELELSGEKVRALPLHFVPLSG